MRARAWALMTLLAAALAAPAAAAEVVLFQEKTSTNATSITAGAGWTTPTNIQADNGSYAISNTNTQNWLTAKTWGVNLPGPVVIHGIMVVVQGQGSNAQTARREFDAALTKDGTNTVGTIATALLLPQTTDGDVVVSTALALWGTTWTEADLESSNWGVMIRDNNTGAHDLNFDSMTVTYAYKTVDQVTSTPTAVIPVSAPQNSVFAALKLQLGTNRNTALLTSVRVSTTGTLNPILVSSVTLYLDNGNGTFGADDTLVSYSTNSFNSVGNVDLRLASPQTLTTTGQTYFVVVGLLSTTTIGGTLGVTLHSQGALSLAEPDAVTTTNFPASSGDVNVTDGPDTVTVTPTSQAPGSANQGTSFSVLRFAMATDQENVQLSALGVTKSGNLPDAGVSAVNLYRDANADGLFDGGDTLVGGPATFSGGAASLTVSPVATLIAASTNYFLVYTLSATASPGTVVGASVTATTALTLAAPDVTRATNFPIASGLTSVVDVADTVTVTPAGLTPGSVVQGTEFAAEKFSLATGGDQATWTAVQVSTKGTLAPASITTVKVYKDTGNGTYGGEDTLISPAVTTFTSGSAEITLDVAQTLTTSAQNYFVVYSLAGSANPGDTTGVAIHAADKFTLSAPDTVSTANFPVSTNLATVIAQGQTMTASRVDMAPGSIAQATADTAMIRLSLVTDSASAEWTAITVTKKGTLADSGVSTVKVYLDANANNTFEPASDTLISPAANTFTAGAVNITLSAAQTINTTPKVYFVVYSLASFPAPGATIGAEVTSNSHLTVTSPDVVATTNFPLASTNATVTDAADTLTVTPTALAPGTVAQGSDYAVEKLSLAVNQDFTVWTALTVTKTGTLADADIDSVKVYRDDGDVSYDAGDTLISPAVTTFSGGSAAVSLSSAQTVGTSAQVYFVVYALDVLATNGNTVGAQVANAAALTVSGTDSTASTNLPASSGNSTVTDAADTVTVTPTALAPGTVLQGAAYALERFSLVTNQETATWTALQVSTTGTLAPILVSSVTVYLDDGDNTFNAGDTLISPAVTTFTGGAANVTLSAAQTLNTTPKVYFVVYGLSSTATVGGSVGATFPSPGKFTLSGVDVVSASNFPTSSGNSTLTDRGDDVVITPTDLGGGQVGQGETRACLKLSLFTPLDASTWTAVTVSTVGNLAPASLDSARVYLDDGNGVFDAGLDPLISPAVTTFTGGSAAITLSAAQVITDTAKDYFLVVVVNVGATIGNTTGLRIHHPGHLTFSAPDPSSGTFPVNGTASTVAAPDTVTVTPTSVGPGLIGQGADYAVMKLSAVTNGNSASMTAVRVTKSGSTARTNISAVKIYLDADASGYYDDNDTLLGSGVYPGGGAVNIALSPAQTLTTTPKSYFVVHALTGGIPVADTVGANIAAETDITIASPDTMATTNFPYSSRLSTAQAADYGVLITDTLIDMGQRELAQTHLMTTGVVVTSTGNIGTTLELKAATVTASSPWVIATAAGADQFTLKALFNSAQPAVGDFGATDALLDSPTACLGGKFVGNQDCRVVRPGDARTLWLLFGLPTTTSTEAVQDFQVTVTATVP